ncbi:hypothetical protein Ddc_24132 [Ditylenchus destructor]|nr:hypothetical protein Ddc_24132 [Ditylenchus destructor]
MRRSVQLAEKQANLKNDAHANQGRLKNNVLNSAALDNGTMVEAFKYLNYCQLAKNSLVSKRFRDVIRTHRHKLALLYVSHISIQCVGIASSYLEVFDKKLSSEAYDEWVIRNNYSKQVPFDAKVASTQITQTYVQNGFLFSAGYSKDPSNRRDIIHVFEAQVELNHENWPAFQHFIRLATDPFIYIDCMELTYQNDVLNLLAGAINSDHDRLQCKQLNFNLKGNSQKSFTWTKNHVRCNQFVIRGEAGLNHEEAFLHFFVTGAHCTPLIKVENYDLSKADVVQKFMNLKNSDESQLVEAIQGYLEGEAVELLNRDYAEFIVKEERGQRSNTHIFEFVNNDIGKKLQLTVEKYDENLMLRFSIKVKNL